MAAEMIFYTNAMSRGRIAHVMLEEVGAPYETVYVPFGPPMKSPEYLAINPMGKVPALRRGEVVVTECAAICAYLADAFPEAALAPPPGSRGAYYRWLFFGSGPLEAAVTNQALGFEPPPERSSTVGYGSLGLVVDTLEAAVGAGPFLCGAQFTAADVYVGAQIGWAMQFGVIEDRPALTGYVARLRARPAWIRATALDDAAMPARD